MFLSLERTSAMNKDRPYLSEERGRAGDGIDQRKIPYPVGLDETDEINGFNKTGEDDSDPPKFRRSPKDEGWEGPKGEKKRKIEKDPPEKDPEKEFPWPVSPLGEKIP